MNIFFNYLDDIDVFEINSNPFSGINTISVNNNNLINNKTISIITNDAPLTYEQEIYGSIINNENLLLKTKSFAHLDEEIYIMIQQVDFYFEKVYFLIRHYMD